MLTLILYSLLRLGTTEDALTEGSGLNPTTDIGARVFELRDERGWGQTELARKAGVSQTTIVHVETGQVQPRMATLRRLAKGFGITVEELIDAPLAAAPASGR